MNRGAMHIGAEELRRPLLIAMVTTSTDLLADEKYNLRQHFF